MKNLFYFLIMTLFVFASGCELKEQNISDEYVSLRENSPCQLVDQNSDLQLLKSNLISKHEIVGITHNKILSEVLDDIKSQNLTITNKAKFIDDIYNSLNRVITNSSFINDYQFSSTEISEYVKNGYYSQFLLGNDSLFMYTNNYIETNQNFSEEFKTILTKLISIFDNKNLTSSEVIGLIDSLNCEAVLNISNEDELNYYFTGSSVAFHSFEYWTNNLNEWITLFESLDFRTSPYDHPLLDGVVGADAGGAVGGAIAGAVFTAGVGAVPAAIVSGSATSSGKFVENLWNYFF